MAKNPWVLPDGFDADTNKAIKALMKALKKSGAKIPEEAFTQLRLGNIDEFLGFVDWTTIREGFGDLRGVMQDAAQKAGKSTYTMGGVDANLLFNLIDARAVDYAQERVGALIVEITEQMRETVRGVIAQAEMGQLTYQQAAIRLQSTIPLTTRDAGAVDKYIDKQFQRFMKQGVSEAKARVRAQNMGGKYAAKLLGSRTRTIARTEIMDASMSGRYLGWEAGVEGGYIAADSVKEWIAEPDACEICSPLDGTLISWNAEWQLPEGVSSGSSNRMPPAHPNCRCSVVILPPDFSDNVFTESSGGEMPDEAVEFAKIPEEVSLNGGMFTEVDADELANRVQEARNATLIEMWEEQNQRTITTNEIQDALQGRNTATVSFNPNLRQRLSQIPQLQAFANIPHGDDPTKSMLDVFIESKRKLGDGGIVDRFITGAAQTKSPLDWRNIGLGAFTAQAKALPPLTTNQVADLATKELQDYVKKSSPTIMIGYDKIDDLLDTQRYKTYFETGATISGSGGAALKPARTFYEKVAFGYDVNVSPSLRPVYGAMIAENNFEPIRFYGDVAIVLKKPVMVRSTVTMGDSFNSFLRPSPATKPVANPIGAISSMREAAYYRKLKDANVADKKSNYFDVGRLFQNEAENPDYVELQVHGGVKLNDIAKVILLPKSRRVEGYDVESLIRRLDALGIAWEYGE